MVINVSSRRLSTPVTHLPWYASSFRGSKSVVATQLKAQSLAIPSLNKELAFRRWDGLPPQLCRVGHKRNQYSVSNRLPGGLL